MGSHRAAGPYQDFRPGRDVEIQLRALPHELLDACKPNVACVYEVELGPGSHSWLGPATCVTAHHSQWSGLRALRAPCVPNARRCAEPPRCDASQSATRAARRVLQVRWRRPKPIWEEGPGCAAIRNVPSSSQLLPTGDVPARVSTCVEDERLQTTT